MKDKITERIKELKASLDEFIQMANAEASARNAVIKELEQLIAEPKAEHPEQPTEAGGSQ